jgi:hypothetical protein
MNFSEAIKSGFGKYVTFSGRAARSEYWYWTLFTVIANMVAGILDSLLGSLGLIGLIVSLAHRPHRHRPHSAAYLGLHQRHDRAEPLWFRSAGGLTRALSRHGSA